MTGLEQLFWSDTLAWSHDSYWAIIPRASQRVVRSISRDPASQYILPKCVVLLLLGHGRFLNESETVWNLACGFAQNTGQLMAFRFLAGLGGSAPLAVSAIILH